MCIKVGWIYTIKWVLPMQLITKGDGWKHTTKDNGLKLKLSIKKPWENNNVIKTNKKYALS